MSPTKAFSFVVFSIILFSGIIMLIPQSYAESKSIESLIILETDEDNRVKINVQFIDVIGQTIRHINYDITARHNSQVILEDTGVHIHDGQGTHVTAPLDINPNSDDVIDVEIIFRGIGINEPYGGPIGKVFQSTEHLNPSQYDSPSTPPTITVLTDKTSYTEGDTVRVFGTVSDNLGIDMTLAVIKPGGKVITVDQFSVKSDKTFETQIMIGSLFDVDGIYSIQVRYGSENTDLIAFEFHQLIQDMVPPLLLVPSDILTDTTDPQGSKVDYSVKAIDDVDGMLQSFCNPSSGSLFPIGTTMVTCQAFDNAGNSMLKSFTVTVQLDPQLIVIPDWVKEVSAFWCNDSIDDASFIEAIQYLIENNVIQVPLSYDSNVNIDQTIPNWIKNNACWWSQGLISDDEFASGLEHLIEQGIVTV